MGPNWINNRVPSLSVAWTVSVLTVVACSDRGTASAGWSGTASDSAGVQLVANPTRGTWTANEAWTVEDVLSIGGQQADEAHQFGKISGIDVDGNGDIYVADVQARNVRVFDPTAPGVRIVVASPQRPLGSGRGRTRGGEEVRRRWRTTPSLTGGSFGRRWCSA